MTVLVLLHGDSLADDGPQVHTVTSTRDEATTCSSAQSVFAGGKSFYFPTPTHTHYVEVDTSEDNDHDLYHQDGTLLTLECRIYPIAFSSTRSSIIDLGYAPVADGWALFLDPAGQVMAIASGYEAYTGVYVTLNEWTAIKVSFGTGDGAISVAVGGNLVAFSPGANYYEVVSDAYDPYKLRIGNSRSAGTSTCFQGYIDEIRISLDENAIDESDPATWAVATEPFAAVSPSALFPILDFIWQPVFFDTEFPPVSAARDISALVTTDIPSYDATPLHDATLRRRIVLGMDGLPDVTIPVNGVISGVVTKQAAPVPNAVVQLYSMRNRQLEAVVTADTYGAYTFLELNTQDKYMVVVIDPDVTATGYGAKALPDIQPITL